MTPVIARALDGLDEAILDGEMLGWDPGPDADGGAFMNHRFVRAATIAMLQGTDRGSSGGGGGAGSDNDDDDGDADDPAGGRRGGGGKKYGGGGGRFGGKNHAGGKPSDYIAFDASSMAGIHLIYNAFDLLWARGRAAERQGVDGDLTSWPLWQRLQMLGLLVVQQPRYVEILPSLRMQVARTPDGAGNVERELAAEFEAAIYRQDEGLVIKKAMSYYTFDGHDGNRSDSWLKLKPDYVEGNAQTLDVVIVGGFRGTGERQRRFTYSHFLLAVRSDEDAPEDSAAKLVTEADYVDAPGSTLPKYMLTVGKVGTGFNYEMLKEINDSMKNNWTETRTSKGEKKRLPAYFGEWKPAFSSAGALHSNWPDAVVKQSCLQHALVVEVKASELVVDRTGKHSSGYCPRFPRTVRIRNDRSVHDSLRQRELETIFRDNNGRLVKSSTGLGESSGDGGGKRKGGRRGKRGGDGDGAAASSSSRGGGGAGTLLSTYAHADTRLVDAVVDIFHRGSEGDEAVTTGVGYFDAEAALREPWGKALSPAQLAERLRHDEAEAVTLARLLDDPYAGLPRVGTPYTVCVVAQDYAHDGAAAAAAAVAAGRAEVAGGDRYTPPALPAEYLDRAKLGELVAQLGGTSVAAAADTTHLLVAANAADLRVQHYMKVGRDVVHPCWLLECLAARGRVPLLPRHLLHASPATAAALSRYDDLQLCDEHATLLQVRAAAASSETAAAAAAVATAAASGGGGGGGGSDPQGTAAEGGAPTRAALEAAEADTLCLLRRSAAQLRLPPPLTTPLFVAPEGGLVTADAQQLRERHFEQLLDTEVRALGRDAPAARLLVHAMSFFRDHPPVWGGAPPPGAPPAPATAAASSATMPVDAPPLACGGGDHDGDNNDEDEGGDDEDVVVGTRRCVVFASAGASSSAAHLQPAAAAGGIAAGASVAVGGEPSRRVGGKSQQRPRQQSQSQSQSQQLVEEEDVGHDGVASVPHDARLSSRQALTAAPHAEQPQEPDSPPPAGAPPKRRRLRREASSPREETGGDDALDGDDARSDHSAGSGGGGGGECAARKRAARAAPPAKAARRGRGCAVTAVRSQRGVVPPRTAAVAAAAPAAPVPEPPPLLSQQGCVAYVDEGALASDPSGLLRLAVAQFRLYRGHVRTALDAPDVNLALVDATADPARALELCAWLATRARSSVPVVDCRWVAACVAHAAQLPVDTFVVPTQAPAGSAL